MRLMAKEDDVYKLMDRRDLYLGAAGLCGIVSVVLLLFMDVFCLCRGGISNPRGLFESGDFVRRAT